MAANPAADLNDLGIDDNTDDAYLGETSAQHIPLELEYNDQEDWFWHYGDLRLYKKFYPLVAAGEPAPLTWLALHRFVTDYAWVEGKLRFIMDKPCWPLHTDAVDRLVMLYYARKNFERVRTTESGKVQTEFLDTLTQITKEIQELLSHCELRRDENGVNPKIPFVHHVPERRAKDWVPSILHRVLQWDGIKLPDSPVMAVTENTEDSANTLLGLPLTSPVDHEVQGSDDGGTDEGAGADVEEDEDSDPPES